MPWLPHSLSFQQPHSFTCVRLRGVLQQWVGYKSGILNGGSRNKYKRFWRILKIGFLIINFESWAFGNAWHQINICQLHRNSTNVILICEQNAFFFWEMPCTWTYNATLLSSKCKCISSNFPMLWCILISIAYKHNYLNTYSIYYGITILWQERTVYLSMYIYIYI